MRYLLDRMIVPLRDRREDLASAVYMYFYELRDEIGRDEMEPRCRQVGEVLLFEGPVRNGGIESYVSLHGWRAERAEDILAGYKLMQAPKRAAIFETIAAHMAVTSDEERHGMASRQGFNDIGFGTPNEWLNEQVSELSALDDTEGDPSDLAVKCLRRYGLIKVVSSEEQAEKVRDAIIAKSPYQTRLDAHRREQGARAQEASRRRNIALDELTKLANLSIRRDRWHVRQTRESPPRNGFVYAILPPSGDSTPPVNHGEVIYFEDGDRGVLARHPDGETLAEVAIEHGATDFVANLKLP